MKVLNLHCARQHAFEGWFASEDDFQSQDGRGLIECPVCGDNTITKGLSAPRLNLGVRMPEASDAASSSGVKRDVMAVPGDPKLQAAWLQAVRHVMDNTEDVGERFADEARRIHYGEAEERSIRGQASSAESLALIEEGIDVLPLPVPKAFKKPLQ